MKNFFVKLKNWFVNHLPSRRRIIQLYTALLYNANIKGFVTGKISTSGSKNVCVPGFNCYSCPGAVGSCPLGSLQNAIGSNKTSTLTYVLGTIALFGLIFGRTICGFLCPMGLLQDLTFLIKSPKAPKGKVTRILSYFKYVLLALFVVAVPLAYSKTITLPAFCQFICPVGTLSGLTLLAHPNNFGELASLGVLFTWKFCVAVLIVVGSVFVYRLFCRFLCPLGALYSLFSRFCLLGVQLDCDKCVDCGRCIKVCNVDIHHVGDHECIQCGKCISACPTQAISWKGSSLFVLPNQIDQGQEEAPNLAQMATVDVAEGADIQQPTVNTAKKVKKPALYTLRKNNGKGFKVLAMTVAIVVLLSALVYFNFFDTTVNASTQYAVGDTIENFVAKQFFADDGSYDLAEDSGKIVVINFWYIGCAGCEAEMPHFGALVNDEGYKDKVSVVVAHSNDDIFGAEQIDQLNGVDMPYLEKYVLHNKSQSATQSQNWNNFYQNITWIMDLDGNESLYLSFGGTGAWPMTAIIDGNGTIRYIAYASVTEELLYEKIDAILAE